MDPADNSELPAAIPVAFTRCDSLLGAGLRAHLEAAPGLELVAADIAVEDLDAVLAEYEPRVLLLSPDVQRDAVAIQPLSIAHRDTAIVALVDHISRVSAVRLLALGASACLPASARPEDITATINLVARGAQLVLSGGAALRLEPRATEPLTPREAEVYELLRRGLTTPKIAETLHVSPNTAHTHVRNILGKFGVNSRRALIDQPVAAHLPETPALQLDAVIRSSPLRQVRAHRLAWGA